MKTKLPKKVVLLGSGGLRIGQAGEFDYSGSQAIKALKEEGVFVVLINPNIATVQTDADMADRVYFQPLNIATVTKILEREKPDGLLLSFGGQTALNLGLSLDDSGVLSRLNINVLGTPVSVIKQTEDRELFKQSLTEIGVYTAKSKAAYTVKQALTIANDLGYPVMMRSGYSLGGFGSGKVSTPAELSLRVQETLMAVDQVLVEEYLAGWKEVEYEVVRDIAGNTITVCNMENFDPMGVHTGESIVVAPSQTLSNQEYHNLREVAIKTIKHLGIVGECNIQYALHPQTGDYRVIEVNARLSRSSALASKATGYPLAYVAAKLAVGYKLHELKNVVTGSTSAFFEPALDYLAVKFPRWDLNKLKSSDHHIGSEMKSVGEVMALGRSFTEAVQKAVRMLNIGADGVTDHPFTFSDVADEIRHPTDRRLFAIADALAIGMSSEKIHKISGIDRWFLDHLASIVELGKVIPGAGLETRSLSQIKQAGFADKTIAKLTSTTEHAVRQSRIKQGVVPAIKQIDTLAGEFDATTNYLYATYHGCAHDVAPLGQKAVAIIGSGPYCIGSSVEFDWCAVNTGKTLQRHGRKTIMINSNPETVSTDFDLSDRLYFEELTLERIQDIADFEKQQGIVVSVGGQIANNLAVPLCVNGYTILGTDAEHIDMAENRKKFSTLLNKRQIDQPLWSEAASLRQAKLFATKVGYPVLVRPSYVLSGGAMNVVANEAELEHYLGMATTLSAEHPTVVSLFITGAKELEVDGVAQNGKLILYAVSEHVENAGVHSGDATVVYPAQRLYLETVRRVKKITREIVQSLNITGPFNIQFIAKDNELKVIECNVRASRSFPFVSKISGINFIEVATEAMLGIQNDRMYQTFDLDHVGVKTSQFSYSRMKGSDPVASVEMASTGEVACIGDTEEQAFLLSWQATDQHIADKSLFLSIPDSQKDRFVEHVRDLVKQGWTVYTTKGTHEYLRAEGIKTKLLHKIHHGKRPSVASAIVAKKFSLMISVPSGKTDNDEYVVRRLGIDNHVPLITNAETARMLLRCLAGNHGQNIPRHWHEYVKL